MAMCPVGCKTCPIPDPGVGCEYAAVVHMIGAFEDARLLLPADSDFDAAWRDVAIRYRGMLGGAEPIGPIGLQPRPSLRLVAEPGAPLGSVG